MIEILVYICIQIVVKSQVYLFFKDRAKFNLIGKNVWLIDYSQLCKCRLMAIIKRDIYIYDWSQAQHSYNSFNDYYYYFWSKSCVIFIPLCISIWHSIVSIRVKPFGLVFVRERSRRIETAAVRPCVHAIPASNTQRDSWAKRRRTGKGPVRVTRGRVKRQPRKEEKKEREEASSRRLPREYRYTRGRWALLVVYTRHNGLKEPAPKSS